MDNIDIKPLTSIKLSYENIIHKKVYEYDYVSALPEGIKSFIWFTTYKEDNVCFLVEIPLKNKLNNTNIKIIDTPHFWKLNMGTILYGTSFNINNSTKFTIEDIHSYRGKRLNHNLTWNDKLIMIKNMFVKNEISKDFFGIPVGYKKFENINFDDLAYTCKVIQFRKMNSKISFNMEYKQQPSLNNQNKNKKIFFVKADLSADIYHLYKNNLSNIYEIALIPNYKTSVFMNKLFRMIKENSNIDLIEESDDEDEFQDNNEFKFVDLNKCIKMECIYSSKFKKWIPFKVL